MQVKKFYKELLDIIASTEYRTKNYILEYFDKFRL